MLGAIDELQRELIVKGTYEGLAAARARSRTGGRRPTLTETQTRMARQMYDSEEYTVQQIADTFTTSRATVYRALADEGDFALIVYRSSGKSGIDADGRPYGETGQGEAVQLEADRKFWPIAAAKRPHLKAIVYVVDGLVDHIRGVDPGGQWLPDARGYWDIPVTAPLTADEVAEQLPTLDIHLGDPAPLSGETARAPRTLISATLG